MEVIERKIVYIFIDAANLWEVQKAKGQFIDHEKLKIYIKNRFQPSDFEIFYYTAYPAEGTRDYSLDGKHKFLVYLEKGLGYTVRKKELKRITIINEFGQTIKEKGNMDVEITVDALHNVNKYDIAILFTGDCDFLSLISYLRNAGKVVYIFSSKNNISTELRTGADRYFEILDIQDNIWGPKLRHRNEKV